MSAEFSKSEEWKLQGTDFLIVVKHYTEPASPTFQDHDDGRHRWNVYAYVYLKHPHFAKFSGPHIIQDASNALPLHGGPSFLRWHYNDDQEPTSVQVGSDYNYIADSEFTFYATEEDASEVFSDARRLHAWLEQQTKPSYSLGQTFGFDALKFPSIRGSAV